MSLSVLWTTPLSWISRSKFVSYLLWATPLSWRLRSKFEAALMTSADDFAEQIGWWNRLMKSAGENDVRKKRPGIEYIRAHTHTTNELRLFVLWFDFVESKKQRVSAIKIIKGCADRCVKYVSVRERNVKLFLT